MEPVLTAVALLTSSFAPAVVSLLRKWLSARRLETGGPLRLEIDGVSIELNSSDPEELKDLLAALDLDSTIDKRDQR